MDDPLDVSQDDPMEGLMDSEQRRWTLLSQKYDGYGWEDEVFDGPELSHGERIEVCPVSELDAALAERDALKAQLDAANQGSEFWRTLHNAKSRDATLACAELAEVRAKAEQMHETLRACIHDGESGRCYECDAFHPAHAPDCPAAPDYLTQSAHDARRQPAIVARVMGGGR